MAVVGIMFNGSNLELDGLELVKFLRLTLGTEGKA